MLGRPANFVPVAVVCICLIIFYLAAYGYHPSGFSSKCDVITEAKISPLALAVDESIPTVECVFFQTDKETAQAISGLGIWDHPKVTFLQAWLMPEAGIQTKII